MKKVFFTVIFLITVFAVNLKAEPKKPLAAYKIDSLWYVIDAEGKGIFNPFSLIYIAGYSEGFYRIYLENENKKLWAYMNDKGEVAIPLCDETRLFKDGMAMIADVEDTSSQLKMFGFINKEGKLMIPKIYIDANDFSEGLAWVMNKEKRGYIDNRGKMIIPWDTTGFGSPFSEGMAAMTNSKDRFGFIDKTGKVVIDYQYDEVTRFVDGLAKVNVLGKWGFIDKKGEMIIPAKYDFAMDFIEGFCFVGIPTKPDYAPLWGIINHGGGHVVTFKYKDIKDFNQGIGAVKEDGKWKFIDYFGQQVIKKEFDDVDSFHDDLAWAVDGDKFGFIDPTGEFQILLPKGTETVIDLRLNKKVK